MWSINDTKPIDFNCVAEKIGCASTDLKFAKHLDSQDSLACLRENFHIPKMGTIHGADPQFYKSPDDPCIYMCGNSLGLLPKSCERFIQEELQKWGEHGVHGHFIGDRPWALCDETAVKSSAKLLGALDSEITLMNGLSVNLNLLLISFYQPTSTRYKIIIEEKAFPSDDYAIQSQLRLHKLNLDEALIRVKPRPGEHTLRTEDILEQLVPVPDSGNALVWECPQEQHGESTAVVMLSAVQYYTGQWFEMEKITKAAHQKGAICGWDLAHAAGNVPMSLHTWEVDFAAWCSYKYMNTGAGGMAGIFVHQKHHGRKDLVRLHGWFGNKMETRFQMSHGRHKCSVMGLNAVIVVTKNACEKPLTLSFSITQRHQNTEMDEASDASAWRISNPPILLVCSLAASLEIFDMTSMEELRAKSIQLTGYMEHLVPVQDSVECQMSRKCQKSVWDCPQILAHLAKDSAQRKSKAYCDIITPSDAMQRGAQLSLCFNVNIQKIYDQLVKRGVACDKRLPYVIRAAPAPLYTRFEDVHRFVEALADTLMQVDG